MELRAAPLVELPLGATLDRLVGALDLRQALAGDHVFEPGILARAHQGILYVDEVNLLADHLVDALLDAAASGVARVEREAVSVEHDARFILVGTMNVEEGELRPQLLDRFGLGVEVRAPRNPGERAEIVRRRLSFERDPAAFVERYADAERELAARIAAARERLEAVRLPERELLRIAGACAALGVDGVRGDLVTARAARAFAALDGAEEVDESTSAARRRWPSPTAAEETRSTATGPTPRTSSERSMARHPPPTHPTAVPTTNRRMAPAPPGRTAVHVPAQHPPIAMVLQHAHEVTPRRRAIAIAIHHTKEKSPPPADTPRTQTATPGTQTVTGGTQPIRPHRPPRSAATCRRPRGCRPLRLGSSARGRDRWGAEHARADRRRG